VSDQVRMEKIQGKEHAEAEHKLTHAIGQTPHETSGKKKRGGKPDCAPGRKGEVLFFTGGKGILGGSLTC